MDLIGGMIAGEHNLSHDGGYWVGEGLRYIEVIDNVLFWRIVAALLDNAQVYDKHL